MVYCGKPSKACAECRIRRTKCDYKSPSCSQCVRAGRTCNGYRDPSDLMFRDESQGLKARRQRARNEEAEKPRASSSHSVLKTSQESSLDTLGQQHATQNSLIPFSELWAPLPSTPLFYASLAPTMEDQATCFFFNNYVLSSNDSQNSRFHYLFEVYSTEEIGCALSDSINALGLVGLAHFLKAGSMMMNAKVKYNSAMKMISSQLGQIEEAKSDQTLMAIMLLGLYETNTCTTRQSMESWTKHIRGASALLQLRGKEQLQTVAGYHMFAHLRTQVITNCIQRHTPVPDFYTEWSTELGFETAEQAASTQLSELAIKYCNLRASMASFQDFSDPERIIASACALEEEFSAWAKTCPLQFIYQTVTLNKRSDEVFSDHYHAYPSIWVATFWNNYRSNRLLVNELILNQIGHLYENGPQDSVLWGDGTFLDNQILNSSATLLSLCHDICASVPYLLGYDPTTELRNPKSVNGNLLIWPLYSAGITGVVSDMMRNWVLDRLQWINDEMGIRQAGPLAQSLRNNRQDLLTWNEDVDISKNRLTG